MKTSNFLTCYAITSVTPKQPWYADTGRGGNIETLTHLERAFLFFFLPQDLLYRRMRSLANFEAANKKLETAKTKNKGLAEAEAIQQSCSSKFDKLSETGKQGKSCKNLFVKQR